VRIEKRVRALESRFKSDPVVLYFGDGSTREIHGPRDFLLRLLVAAAWGRDLSPGQQEQLELIRASVDSVEPDGAHLVDVVKCHLEDQRCRSAARSMTVTTRRPTTKSLRIGDNARQSRTATPHRAALNILRVADHPAGAGR